MSPGQILPQQGRFLSSAEKQRNSCQSLVLARRTGLAISLSKSPNIEIVKSGIAKSLATSEIASAKAATAIMPVFPDVMADAEPL
jgi:hypothetical protein